ncbi:MULTISPECIES: YoaK family protein [unclassified Streptomyces]|uniref:YoaK family protein n=1 Tax=unclassified Streptomyces TaxID=2593676 RepID=UPI00331DE6B7
MPESSSGPASASAPVPVDRAELRTTVIMTVLTVVAGAVDAITFLTMGHVFAALETGNVLFLTFALAGSGPVSVVRPAVALVTFAFGVATAAYGIRALLARGRRWFPAALATEGVLLAVAGTQSLLRRGTGPSAHGPDLVALALVALAMGVRSAVVLRVAVPGMPTLLLQMSLVQLVADVATAPRVPDGEQGRLRRLARTRLTATIGGMFVGGTLGTLAARWGTGCAFLAVAAVVMALALSGVHDGPLRRRPPAPPPS